ncbi:HAD family hydrolase [Clostridium gasigenes]|uniref:HAD family hydrolase n=1 Tax=Clostridium gasigenes TaxID=94869 RepID=UPI0014382F19|nr:HAD family hydrolase [Clostridium gasigenes]MBU3131404.1 HAD family hydrolase [Clostridium gasigenes]NKF08385.1 HAD family hydrolase [Clostridium gasigenes]QSW18651.1 HAD family hydrolase [Clostridium gasigenes]
MYKAIIFDLDGTLLDTLEDLANACNYALKECGLSTYEVNKYKKFVGDGRYKLIERIIPKQDYTEDLFNKVLKLYDDYYLEHMVDETKPYEGICELLDELRGLGIKLAVVSNKPHEFTIEMVKNYFNNKIDIVFGQRKNYQVKPNPETIFEVMNEFKLEKEECVYVGDSNVDMQTAKNAEVKSIGVSWGFRGRKELEQSGANIVVDTVEELRSVLIN